MEACWYSSSATEFLHANLDSVYAEIVRNSVFDVNSRTKESWDEEIDFLHELIGKHADCHTGQIIFEYPIPQLCGRIDVVFLYKGVVFLLEFKTGAADKKFSAEAKRQVVHYALDLKYFHAETKNRKVVPILVVPSANGFSQPQGELIEGVRKCQCCSSVEELYTVLQSETEGCSESSQELLTLWRDAVYSPVPTIIDAARALYAQHSVADITKTSSEDDIDDVKKTLARLNEIINDAKANNKKVACLLTGVPGAGKTLVGLSLAIDRERYHLKVGDEGAYKIEKTSDNYESAVFLSGNGPLVDVLQHALSADARKNRDAKLKDLRIKKDGSNVTVAELDTTVKQYLDLAIDKTFVKDVMGFRNDYLNGKNPTCQIAIFDEAQRAWTNKQLLKKNGKHADIIKDQSEPACLIDQMDKRDDWAVVVCLVGGGQEIHDGEAGIIAWLDALSSDKFAQWKVYASDFMSHNPGQFELKSNSLPNVENNHTVEYMFSKLKTSGRLSEEPLLHLNVNNRSIRSNKVSLFADALVNGRGAEAKALCQEIIKAGFPVFVTRELDTAKEWVRIKAVKDDQGEPLQRYGILASSSEQRLRAEGVCVPKEMNIVYWMLGDSLNVDSSYAMEIAASEFKVQGLEIDYAVVVWGGDYRYEPNANRKMTKKEKASLNGNFYCSGYSGHSRNSCTNKTEQDYLRNAYRVLLTRSRMGMVIYVPKGDDGDVTRRRILYESNYKFLTEQVGIKDLNDVQMAEW